MSEDEATFEQKSESEENSKQNVKKDDKNIDNKCHEKMSPYVIDTRGFFWKKN